MAQNCTFFKNRKIYFIQIFIKKTAVYQFPQNDPRLTDLVKNRRFSEKIHFNPGIKGTKTLDSRHPRLDKFLINIKEEN